MTATDNWYLVLDLDIDPKPEESATVIDQRIKDKISFWTANTNDAVNGHQYDIWRSQEAQIRLDMGSPAKQHAMAKAAIKIKYGDLDDTLNKVTGNNSKPITPDQLNGVAAMRGLPLADVERRARSLGMKIAAGATKPSPAVFQAAFDKYYSEKPAKYAMFSGYTADIAAAKATDLYEFLQLNAQSVSMTLPDPRSSATSTLCDTADKITKAFVSKLKPEDHAKRIVGSYCRTAFKDDATRRCYDDYLKYVARRKLIDEIALEIDKLHAKRCTSSECDDYVLRLMALFRDRKTTTEFFTALCEVKGFGYDLGVGEPTSLKSKLVCLCGMANDIDKTLGNRQKCVRCGRLLLIVCPDCGTACHNTDDYCGCGFEIVNMERACELCRLAGEALDRFDLDLARTNLAEAKGLAAKLPDVAKVEKRLNEIDDEIGVRVTAINRAVADRRFTEAKKKLTELQTAYPRYSNPTLLKLIDTRNAEAAAKLAVAKQKSGSTKVLKAAQEVNAISVDIPGLAELVAKFTKLPISTLGVHQDPAKHVEVSIVKGMISVGMTVPDQGETSIAVIYRRDRFPDGIDDPRAKRKDFSLKTLQQDGILTLEAAEPHPYFVRVFLGLEVGEHMIYSAGKNQRFEAPKQTVLTYTVRKRFGRKITLQFTGDDSSGRLPEIHVVFGVGKEPQYESSGTRLLTIPAQTVWLPYDFEMDAPSPLPPNTYIKPFVRTGQETYQLRLATNSTNRIS